MYDERPTREEVERDAYYAKWGNEARKAAAELFPGKTELSSMEADAAEAAATLALAWEYGGADAEQAANETAEDTLAWARDEAEQAARFTEEMHNEWDRRFASDMGTKFDDLLSEMLAVMRVDMRYTTGNCGTDIIDTYVTSPEGFKFRLADPSGEGRWEWVPLAIVVDWLPDV